MAIATITVSQLNAVQGFEPAENSITSVSNNTSWDLNLAARAVLTLTENTTLLTPTNQKSGAEYRLRVIQDSTPRTLAFESSYAPAADLPIIGTGSGNVSLFTFRSDGSKMMLMDYVANAGV